MRKNVGTLDASVRITAGLLGLAYGIGRMSRRPHRAPWLLMTLSAMRVAEGITRFCPMLYAMGISTRERHMGRVRRRATDGVKKPMRPVTDERSRRHQPAAAVTKPATAAKPAAPATAVDVEDMIHALTEPAGETRRKPEPDGFIRPKRARKLPKRPSAMYRQEEHLHPTYS